MAVNNELVALQGVDTVAYARKLSEAKTVSGQLVPWQTGVTFDPSRDSDSTVTKSGNVQTSSTVTTESELDFVHNTSAIADAMYDSLFDGEVLEIWVIYRKRRNATGQYFAWYYRVTVSEDSNENDPDGPSTRSVSFAVQGKPKRGWVTLSEEQQDELDYVFRGLDKVTDSDETGKGKAWDGKTDGGVNVVAEDPKA